MLLTKLAWPTVSSLGAPCRRSWRRSAFGPHDVPHLPRAAAPRQAPLRCCYCYRTIRPACEARLARPQGRAACGHQQLHKQQVWQANEGAGLGPWWCLQRQGSGRHARAALSISRLARTLQASRYARSYLNAGPGTTANTLSPTQGWCLSSLVDVLSISPAPCRWLAKSKTGTTTEISAPSTCSSLTRYNAVWTVSIGMLCK